MVGTMRFRLAGITVVAVLAMACMPAMAHAVEPAGAELVGRTVTTVSGTQMAEDLVDNIDSVAVGSGSTTVTLDVNGEKQPVTISYDELLNEAGVDGGTGGIVPLALISAALGGLFKFVRVLTRLGR